MDTDPFLFIRTHRVPHLRRSPFLAGLHCALATLIEEEQDRVVCYEECPGPWVCSSRIDLCRYSDQFRLPAGPTVTETLKGGEARLRGANPMVTSRTTPMPTLEKKSLRRRRRSKRNAAEKAK